VDRRIEGITDANRLGCFNKQSFEFVGYLLYQNESLGRKTDLACIMESALDTSRNRCWDVGVFENNKGIRAAQFHHCFLDDPSSWGRTRRTRTYASRYRSSLDSRIIDDVDHVSSLDDQVLEDTLREAGLQHHSLEFERTPLCVHRVLHEHNIAGQHGRDSHACQLPYREVPRHDS